MSRAVMGALAALIGAFIGTGALIALDDVRAAPEAIAPVAVAATERAGPGDAQQVNAPQPSADADVEVAVPVRVIIPSIDVDADLVGVGLNDDGSMEVPDFGEAGWYELGPRPGASGPAVIAAHVDSVDGPDVFFRLRELERGAKIHVVHADGSRSTFRMRKAEQQRKEELPTKRIWNNTDDTVLRLVTCGGDFDTERRSYDSNVIVYAGSVRT